MNTIIIVSEGDEQSTFTSKRAMCDAYGWDYRKFRNSKGVPKKAGRYRLEKIEVGLTIPCRRLRGFLAKKIDINRFETGDDSLRYEIKFRGAIHYIVNVNERGKVVDVIDFVAHEEMHVDQKTYELLHTAMGVLKSNGDLNYGF